MELKDSSRSQELMKMIKQQIVVKLGTDNTNMEANT